jgi:hypothetical protein
LYAAGFSSKGNFYVVIMIWIASFGYRSTLGTNMTTVLANRQNIATEAFAFVFLIVWDNIMNPRYCTTELCEQTFAGWRCESCEATVVECLSIEDKRYCKVNAICDVNLAVHCNPQSG